VLPKARTRQSCSMGATIESFVDNELSSNDNELSSNDNELSSNDNK